MSARPATAVALMVAAAVVLAFGPLVLPPFYVRVGQLMLYSAGLGVAWAILGGFAGYASFGHAAFIGLGAYAVGIADAHGLTDFLAQAAIAIIVSGLFALLREHSPRGRRAPPLVASGGAIDACATLRRGPCTAVRPLAQTALPRR